MEPQPGGDEGADKGGKHTGNKSRVIRNTDADHFHPKHGGGQGSPENSSEAAAHAAHDGNLFIPLIHMKKTAQGISNASPDLQRRPLFACGSACQMAQDGGNKNTGQRGKTDLLRGGNGFQDQIGPLISHLVQGLMHQYDEDAGYRHQKEHKWILAEKLLGISNTKPEGCSHQAADRSH